MATVNLRNVDDTLVSRAKIEAIRRGMSLKELISRSVENLLKEVADDKIGVQAGTDAGDVRVRVSGGEKARASEPKRCEHGTAKGYNCWQCGGLAVIK